MTRSRAIAESLARIVFLLRDHPDDRETQKSAFRALLVRLTDQPLHLVATDGRFLVNGEPIGVDVAGGEALRRQLIAHGIGELKVPGGLPPAQLLVVVRSLAAPPGTWRRLQQLADHYASAGVPPIEILPPVRTQSAAPMAPSTPVAPGPSPTAAEPAPDDGQIEALGPDAANEESVGLLHFVTLETRTIGRLDEVLLTLEQDPGSSRLPDLLNELVAFSEAETDKERWPDLLRCASALVRLESLVEQDSQRRLYHIALRRIVTRSAMEQVARMTLKPETRAEAVMVLRRIGSDATEVLVQLLIAEQDVGHRRGYFNAITQMTEGSEYLVNMLGHDEWFVVRNVAELCGEMKLEMAVPELSRLVGHSDERVRRAAAISLARIGTPPVMEPLRRALQDTSPLVRAQTAAALEGEPCRTLVPALGRLIEEESHPEVLREMLHALGRIGTADAVASLTRATEPVRGLFRKKNSELRIGAIEGLQLSGTPMAVETIRELLQDKDPQVREAAARALRPVRPAPGL